MLTIAEVLKLPDGEVIEAVGGILTITGPREERPRGDGTTYFQQHFSLKDETGEITGTCYDHPIGYEYENGKFNIWASMKAGNNRFGGVTVATVDGGGSLFARKPAKKALKVSKLGSLRTIDGYKLIENDGNRKRFKDKKATDSSE